MNKIKGKLTTQDLTPVFCKECPFMERLFDFEIPGGTQSFTKEFKIKGRKI